MKYIIFIVVALMFFNCSKEHKNKEISKPLIIGNKYSTEYKFDKNDPFEKIRYDTVIILDLKDGYVKYQPVKFFYIKDTNMYFSTHEEYFLKKIVK